mgnify:FL=1
MLQPNADVNRLNEILSQHGHLIIGRQGIPFHERNYSIISLVLDGTTDEIGSLTGKIGRLENIRMKSVLIKNKSQNNDEV